MEHIQISCSFNDEIFNAGEVGKEDNILVSHSSFFLIVTALIRISSYPSNALIFAQVRHHLDRLFL